MKVAQESARHSTPTPTIGRYSHTRLHDLTGALDALPDLNPRDERPTQQQQRSTGTCGESAQRQAQRAGRETLRIGAAPSERGSENATDPDRAKTLKFSENNKPTRPNASSCEILRGFDAVAVSACEASRLGDSPSTSAAESGAVDACEASLGAAVDPDLARFIDRLHIAWPTLSAVKRAAILTLIDPA